MASMRTLTKPVAWFSMRNLPSESVRPVVVLPSMRTTAPGMGSLVASSTTVPRRVDCAALLNESISVNPKRALRRDVRVLIGGQEVKKKKGKDSI